MKVRPIILCGGEGTRLWDNKKNIKPKQFINFGSWTLFDQTLKRIKSSLFDYPIISTNRSYEKKIINILKKNNFKKYKIVLDQKKKILHRQYYQRYLQIYFQIKINLKIP